MVRDILLMLLLVIAGCGTYEQLGGDEGDEGRRGEEGTQGEDGMGGTPGSTGQPGERGATGPSGSNGEDGLAGEDGRDGRDGTDGTDEEDAELILCLHHAGKLCKYIHVYTDSTSSGRTYVLECERERKHEEKENGDDGQANTD